MTTTENRTIPLTITVPENHENLAIIDVIDSYASVHATYVERNSIYNLPDTWRNACGFYILFSPIKEDGTYTVYVGKSDKDFTKRMRSHDQKKEGWVVALLVQRKSVEGLSSTQSSYLEGALRDVFVSAPHVQCQNIARTGDWTLPEHEKIIMSQVVDSTLRIMLLRGYRGVLAKKTVPTIVTPASTPFMPVPPTPRLAAAPPAMPKLSMSVPSTPPQEAAVATEPARKLPFSPPVMTPPAVPQVAPEPVVEAEPKKTGFSLFGRKKAEPKAPPKPEEVYAALLEWRQEQARVLHTKYRFILEDYTLKALSEKMPKTYDELLTMPGIKEKKQAQFGKSILAVLDRLR